jgi:hypothetical protein
MWSSFFSIFGLFNNVITDEKNISGSNHNLGFRGHGIDDFIQKKKEGSLSLIGLKTNSRGRIQRSIFQVLKYYLVR